MDILISVLDIVFLVSLVLVINFYTRTLTGDILLLLPDWLTDRNSLSLIGLFLILFSAKNLLGFFIHKKQSEFIGLVATRLSKTKLREYLEGAFSDYVRVDSSTHLNKISRQPIDFAQHILGGLQQIITQACLIVVTIAVMIAFDARVFLFLFALLLPPVFIVFYVVKAKLKSARANSQISIEKSWQHLREALGGFVESNIYNKHNFFIKRYIHYQREFNKSVSELLIIQGIPNRLIEIFALLGLFILIASSKGSTTNGHTVLTITAFVAAAYKIIPGIVKILNTSGQISNYAYTLDDLQTRPKPNQDNAKADNSTPIRNVKMQDVRFGYEGVDMISDFNLSIRQGDFIGISGCSGAGKTTILHLLLGFLPAASGYIAINGKKQGPTDFRQLWNRISYVKQQTFILHDSIARNIVLDESFNEQRLESIIKVAGLEQFFTGNSEGTMVMENGKNISGGQRQRIAIARALYKDADLILLDEPFNELDETTENRFLEHFVNLTQQGKTIILITHNRESFRYCNKVISLDEQLV